MDERTERTAEMLPFVLSIEGRIAATEFPALVTAIGKLGTVEAVRVQAVETAGDVPAISRKEFEKASSRHEAAINGLEKIRETAQLYPDFPLAVVQDAEAGTVIRGDIHAALVWIMNNRDKWGGLGSVSARQALSKLLNPTLGT